MRRVTLGVSALLAAVVLAVVVMVELWSGATEFGTFRIAFVGTLSVIGVIAYFGTRSRLSALFPVASVVLLLVCHLVDLSPVKPALRAVSEIRAGMTEAEVRTILDRQFPVRGRFHRPNFGSIRSGVLSFVLDPTDSAYNAAVVEVRFAGNRCTSAAFLPD
jgi:hypothetical protein